MKVINSLVYTFVYLAVYLATQILIETAQSFGLSGAAGLIISYAFTLLICLVLSDGKLNLPGGYSLFGISFRSIISAILLTVSLMGVAWLCVSLDIFAPFLDSYAPGVDDILGSQTLIFIIFCFIAPIFEELMFRGLIYGKLRRAMPYLLANILQALLFAALHGNLIQGIYTFILAFLLAFVLERTRCIYIPCAIHILFNMFSTSAGIYFEMPQIWIIVLLVVVSMTAGILLLPKGLTKRR